jgi:hypothetical protein
VDTEDEGGGRRKMGRRRMRGNAERKEGRLRKGRAVRDGRKEEHPIADFKYTHTPLTRI